MGGRDSHYQKEFDAFNKVNANQETVVKKEESKQEVTRDDYIPPHPMLSSASLRLCFEQIHAHKYRL